MRYEMEKVRVHVFISGRVQGVLFRASTQNQAYKLGIHGWVKNRWNGQVEAIFEGDEEAVQKMISWVHHGPPGAIVENVKIEWEKYEGEFTGFSIRY